MGTLKVVQDVLGINWQPFVTRVVRQKMDEPRLHRIKSLRQYVRN